MSNAVVFAYCSESREVLWFFEDDDDDWEGKPRHNLFTNMSNWLARGETFTILEYHPNGFDPATGTVGDRAVWWDNQLHNLGYDIYKWNWEEYE